MFDLKKKKNNLQMKPNKMAVNFYISGPLIVFRTTVLYVSLIVTQTHSAINNILYRRGKTMWCYTVLLIQYSNNDVVAHYWIGEGDRVGATMKFSLSLNAFKTLQKSCNRLLWRKSTPHNFIFYKLLSWSVTFKILFPKI